MVEERVTRLKVRVRVPLSPDDLAHLHTFNCEEQPYFTTTVDALFAASPEYEEQLRALDCVLSVEPMPVLKTNW